MGDAGDDFVGCDTLNDLFYCYNEGNFDNQYGEAPPAVGFKYLVGPTVLAPEEILSPCSAPQEGMGMTAFSKFINGTDPDNATESYWYMQGLRKDGFPYDYLGNALTYMHSGDPVAGTGDLDYNSSDRRMFASSGPFNLPPDHSAYMLLRMAARHGESNLDAVTELKRVLNLPFDMQTNVAGASPDELPNKFAVRQNYPNPFNPSTTIKYSLPEQARVTVDVFNVLGQKVKRLVDKTQPAGAHSVVWNGDNEGGEPVSTGLYFYRVKAGDKIDQKKMLLLK